MLQGFSHDIEKGKKRKEESEPKEQKIGTEFMEVYLYLSKAMDHFLSFQLSFYSIF